MTNNTMNLFTAADIEAAAELINSGSITHVAGDALLPYGVPARVQKNGSLRVNVKAKKPGGIRPLYLAPGRTIQVTTR